MNNDKLSKQKIAILGGGNIGQAIAKGLVKTGGFRPSQVHITRRQSGSLSEFKKHGYKISNDNAKTVAACDIIIIAVQPGQLIDLLDSIGQSINHDKHIIISTVTGVSIEEIAKHLDSRLPIIRVMPNTAVAIGESMTCLAGDGMKSKAIKVAEQLFGSMGQTLIIKEAQMTSATALCACGVAFFLRSIRAASQGGIQIGFPAGDALLMAAQTARGAASLLQEKNVHPESEIDKVTTPQGCTIAGLNRMEHEGFSSAMIKGLVTAAEIANSLFPKED